VSFGSIFTYIGIAEGVELLKVSGTLVEVAALLVSLSVVCRRARFIDRSTGLVMLLLFLWPLTRIVFESVSSLDTKTILDGLVLRSAHYQLPLIALAAVLAPEPRGLDYRALLLNYARIALPLAAVMLYYALYIGQHRLGIAYSCFASFLVPSALLVYFTSSQRAVLLGCCALVLLLVGSALIGSRSYNIVAIMISLFAITRLRRPRKSDILMFVTVSAIAVASYAAIELRGVPALSAAGIALVEKYQYGSFVDALSKAIRHLDARYLFYWEGNSRARILENAFAGFSMSDWLFGRGILATYSSFVRRSTIELGWAQETFRWGLVYTVPLLLLLLAARRRLVKRCRGVGSDAWYALATLILVRIVDGFIFGMPNYDVYNLLVYFAVMSLAVKTSKAVNYPGFASGHFQPEKVRYGS